MSIILFLTIFGVIVISHELGHFVVARINGIRVLQFWIGVGPTLFSFEKGGTKFALKLLPLGGACVYEADPAMMAETGGAGADGFSETEEDRICFAKDEQDRLAQEEQKCLAKEEQDCLAQEEQNLVGYGAACSSEIPDTGEQDYGCAFALAGVWRRIATVFAGPFFNMLLGFFLAMIVVGFTGADQPVIQQVSEGGAAQEAGLKAGDTVVKMDHERIHLYREVSLNSAMNTKGKTVTFTVEREGQLIEIPIRPIYNEEEDRYYFGFSGGGMYSKCIGLDVVKYAYFESAFILKNTIKSLELICTGNIRRDSVSGPVGVANIVGESYQATKQYGILPVVIMMLDYILILSINLGVMNLIPLPALDGGRLVFLLLEVVRGKPIPPEKEGLVHLAGMLFFLVVMVVVLFNDIMLIMGK